MADSRVTNFAKILVEHSARIVPGDRVLIEATTAAEPLIRDAGTIVTEIIESCSVEERTDPGLIQEKVRVDLQRVFRKRSGRRPLVVPVIMEI